MGKALIIKNADFSVNAIGTIEELYEDITNQLLQGVVATSSGTAKLFNSSYNNTGALIPKFLILMASSTSLYDTSGKGVEWFVPNTLQVLPFVHKKTSTIASDGTISNCVVKNVDAYIYGTGTWIVASDIYAKNGESQSTYPCYNLSICRVGSPLGDLTLAQAIALGLRVRKLRGV